MRVAVPVLLSVLAGYVDTAGFLALQGLFTGHVTGNFVTLGASFVFGTSGAVPKLLALPVFCLVVMGVRALGYSLARAHLPQLRSLIALKLVLLALGAVLALRLGPFPDGDTWQALTVGMVLVAAMAVQNAAQRIHLGAFPPTTVMTGNFTLMMLDFADVLRGSTAKGEAPDRVRLERIVTGAVSFGIGCAFGALLFARTDMWCFAVPPVLGLVTLLLVD